MLKQRTLTALVLAPIGVAIVLLLPTAVLAVVLGAVLLLSIWEWLRLAGLQSPPLRAAILALNALLLVLLWRLRAHDAAWYVVGAGVAWWLLVPLWLRHSSYAAAPTRENAVVKLLAGEATMLPAWLALMRIHGDPDHGPAWALVAIVLVWAADIAAYFAGKRFGRTKLAPRISPNKTWAGVGGALLGGAAFALVAGCALDVRGAGLAALAALALVAVAASIVGDLLESLLKRQANVKDSGTLFPGHGGLLDRFDSVFAALPVFVAGHALIGTLLR